MNPSFNNEKCVKKCINILNSTKYIGVVKGKIVYIAPIMLKNLAKIWAEADSKDVFISWKYLSSNYNNSATLHELLNSYNYRKENCCWISKSSPPAISLSFYNSIPIEISSLFDSLSDVDNMISKKKDIVLEQSGLNSEIKWLILYKGSPYGHEVCLSSDFSSNLFDNKISTPFSLYNLFHEQEYVENNTIYTKNGGYFRFYKMNIAGFEEALK
jgi:hypothetical protein